MFAKWMLAATAAPSRSVTLSLLLTMVVCFVLGMPPPAAYAVAAALLAAPLTKLGFARLPTHLFICYLACLATGRRRELSRSYDPRAAACLDRGRVPGLFARAFHSPGSVSR